jgi:hypothetical protein
MGSTELTETERQRIAHVAAGLVDTGLVAVRGGCIDADGVIDPEAATPAALAFLDALATELNGWCSLLDFDPFNDAPPPARLRLVAGEGLGREPRRS